jgi:transcriptional regulator with XRE-family HTH domain
MSKDRSSKGGPPGRDRACVRRELGVRLALVLEEFADRGEAARAAGCSERALADFVAGRRFPPLEVAARIAERTGVSLDWLASGEEPMTRAWRPAAASPPATPEHAEARPERDESEAVVPAIDSDLLAMVIGMILEALEEDGIELYSFAMAKLISLVYVAVAEADATAAEQREDVVEVARKNLRRLVPLVLSEGPR